MREAIINFSRRLLYFLREIGFDPIRLVFALQTLPFYLLDLFRFKQKNNSNVPIVFSPSLNDKKMNAGTASGHYFWQDIICAHWVKNDVNGTHLDLGSRIDGFITHVSIFCNVELLDIRPLVSEIPNVSFKVRDILKANEAELTKFHTVSSLHSIEHFGLGRYGDPIVVNGHEIGLLNLAGYVEIGGFLYVSFPIGKPRVEFNSQRVLSPDWPVLLLNNFQLIEFILIPWKGAPIHGLTPEQVDRNLFGQAGLYKFKKISD